MIMREKQTSARATEIQKKKHWANHLFFEIIEQQRMTFLPKWNIILKNTMSPQFSFLIPITLANMFSREIMTIILYLY